MPSYAVQLVFLSILWAESVCRAGSCLHSFIFFFSGFAHYRDVYSFPTRRSSDLPRLRRAAAPHRGGQAHPSRGGGRSEEHTSELQSRVDLVCRRLLEKKNRSQQTRGYFL